MHSAAKGPARPRDAATRRAPRHALRGSGAPDGENGDFEPTTSVLRKFRLVFNAVRTHFQQVERMTGLGGAQVWALSIVHERPGIGVTELARAMDVHQTTASNLVKALAGAALLAADRNGPDRRAVHLRLRPAGRRVLSEAPAPFAGVLPEALLHLDPMTLERLRSDLEAVLQQLRADEDAAGVTLSELP